jgi:hypothetical protein
VGPQDRRRRGRQHLHPGAGRGPGHPVRPAPGGRAGPVRRRRRAPGGGGRPGRAHAGPGRLGRPPGRTGRRAEAIDGADVVVVQLRVGGQAMRLVDETLPLEFGCVGQETTGPGGFAKALRTVPVVLELAEETARRAPPGPGSSTSPTRSASSPRPCSTGGTGPSGCATRPSGSSAASPPCSGVAPDRVELEHVGLNHLTWERAVRVDGADRLPSCWRPRPRAGRRPRACRWPCSRTSGRALDLPALLLRHRPGAGRAAAPALAGRAGGRDRARACWSCTATRPWTPSRSCWSGAAGPSTARPRPP